MNKTYSNQLKDFAKNNLQVHFADITVLEEAFTHSSYLNEHKYQCLSSNERLEFLGDAVINLAVAEELFIKYPDQNEGGLSKMRSLLINGSTLATVAKNPKVVLQEWLQKNRRILPEYKVAREIGKDPHKTFEIHVSVSGKVEGIGTGHSKIDAERQAAQSAIVKLSIVI